MNQYTLAAKIREHIARCNYQAEFVRNEVEYRLVSRWHNGVEVITYLWRITPRTIGWSAWYCRAKWDGKASLAERHYEAFISSTDERQFEEFVKQLLSTYCAKYDEPHYPNTDPNWKELW